MRVVLDVNILVLALISPGGHPDAIYRAWAEGRFTMLSCAEQLDELRSTLQKQRILERIQPHKAGRLLNQIRKLAVSVDALPRVQRSPDPEDDYLLGLCEASEANYLVTGDKSGLLSLERHKATRIVTAREFSELLA